MTGAEADLLAALLGAVRRLHFGAGAPAYRHQPCDFCHLVTRAEQELAQPIAGELVPARTRQRPRPERP